DYSNGASIERSWMNGNTPARAIARAMVEEALDEQRDRWKRGDRAPVESYVARYPALEDDREFLLDLIYQEILLRRRDGESPGPEEDTARFPAWTEELIRQFAVDQAMGGAGNAGEGGALSNGEGAGSGREGASGPGSARSPEIDGYEVIEILGRGG